MLQFWHIDWVINNMEQQIISISQINDYIRSRMDADPLLSQIAVRGEISNYKMYPSGHHYFTLKDEDASLKCVMFKGNAVRLRFRPENGMKVIALGRITVYPRDGAFQLYCASMSPDGIGDLHVAFEQLKAKLATQGLFNQEHKKPIPRFPQIIALITSSAGAAVHDMLRILNKRYPLTKVLLLPVRVQGVEAPLEIASAIQFANRHNLADVLIVGRGGGSIEDLWAFNDERVAYAIYHSQIPIISAVGHEPDVTISDYVADLRAATPSNAAELVVPDQSTLLQSMDGALSAMISALQRQIQNNTQRLQVLSGSSVMQNPAFFYETKEKVLTILTGRLLSAQQKCLNHAEQQYIALVAKLDAMSPLKVMARGYSITEDSSGKLLRSIYDVQIGDEITVSLQDGTITASVINQKENGL